MDQGSLLYAEKLALHGDSYPEWAALVIARGLDGPWWVDTFDSGYSYPMHHLDCYPGHHLEVRRESYRNAYGILGALDDRYKSQD